MNYVGQCTFNKPLEEARLRAALVQLCQEDNIEEDSVSLEMMDSEPHNWPAGPEGDGSFFIEHYVRCYKPAMRLWPLVCTSRWLSVGSVR